jgi:AraC-like DNA-binding protein
MEEEQVFLDPELRLVGLSNQLSVHKNELSAHFSERDTNFRTYINNYRLDYFLSLLKEGKHQQMTLLALAFDSGFNSKPSFNRLFKEKVGMSPTEYLSARSQS